MANDRVQEAIKDAKSELGWKEASEDLIWSGNRAIATLLTALLQEVSDLRAELAARR
jgi:hypothetical protein